MDFGLFFLMQRDEAWTEQAVYESALDQMLAAEALGYRSVWIAEHHFNDYGLCPAPPVLASYRRGAHAHAAARHGREPPPLASPGGPRRAARRARRGERWPPRRRHRARRDAPGLPDLPVRPRRQPRPRRGGHRADARVLERAPFDFRGRFHRAERLHVRPRPASARTRRSSSPPTARTACARPRASACPRCRRSSCRSDELQRRHAMLSGRGARVGALGGRGRRRLMRQSWGMRVVHVSPTRDEALRATEAPFMGYQRRIATLRSESHGRRRCPTRSTVRWCACGRSRTTSTSGSQ